MGMLLQDLRYAVRMLRRSPGFAAAAILSMALGIGANTAIFSLIHTLLLRPLPVQAPEELVEPISWLPESDSPRANAFAWKHYTHFRDHARAFSSLIAVSPARLQADSGDGAIESIEAEYAVGAFFPTLGLQPALGRLLGPDDDRAESSGAAVISWAYGNAASTATQRCSAGRCCLTARRQPSLALPRARFSACKWASARMSGCRSRWSRVQQPSRLADGSLTVRIMGRLQRGVSRAQAQAEMRVLDQPRIEELVKRAQFWREVHP